MKTPIQELIDLAETYPMEFGCRLIPISIIFDALEKEENFVREAFKAEELRGRFPENKRNFDIFYHKYRTNGKHNTHPMFD